MWHVYGRSAASASAPEWGHEALSVFGVGQDISEQEWRSALRQLIALDVLAVDHAAYGTLALTDASRAVLKGERTVMLRKQSTSRPGRREKTERVARLTITPQDFSPTAQGLFDRLRAWRAETAKTHGVPAYVIFHDATLRQIAERVPRTLDELRGISGVGAKKLEAYGEKILHEVARDERSDASLQTESV